jgi:hypothetical protein
MWLLSEPVLPAAIAEPKGSCRHICQHPENTYGSVAPTFFIKLETFIPIPSRSIIRHHNARTLSNNRRTLSPKPWGKCFRKSFTLAFSFQNQEVCDSLGRQIHLHKKQFFPELSTKPTIKIKCGKSPQCPSLGYGVLFAV